MKSTNINSVNIPDISTWFNFRKQEIKSEINCMLIGTIQSFDETKQTATILINYKRVVKGIVPFPESTSIDNLAGDKIVEYPLLVDCPVVVMNGGGAVLTFPIAAGDTCLVFFCDRDIDSWFATGTALPPNSTRMHDLSDGIALVGIRSLKNPISDFNTKLAALIDRTGERLCQSGFLQPYAGATAPSGWILCYGQSISKTSYPDLFDVIGYTYGGAGDAFNVPDLRGRAAVGLDNMGGSNADVLSNSITPGRNTLGNKNGQETINILHKHNENTSGVIFGNSSVPPSPGSTSAGFLDTYHYHNIANDLSATQTIMQPNMMVNWIIKI